MRHGNARTKWLIAANLALILAGLLQITGTYRVFSHTWDEPAHIAAGMQLLDRGQYDYELHHPPLARLATATGPYLAGSRSFGEQNMWQEGWRLLYDRGDYEQNLTLARLGILPFFVLLAGLTWYWTQWLWGLPTATLASFFLITQPTILAHAGLATTDLPMVALGMWSLLSFVLWLEKPSYLHSVILGISTGLAFMTKFSAIPFLAVCFLAVMLYRWLRDPGSWNPSRLVMSGGLLKILLSTAMLFISAWAVFGFAWSDYPQTKGPETAEAAYTVSLPMVLTATAGGIKELMEHNSGGHYSYLLGEWQQHGWWYFFPVAIMVKTTIPLLLCAAFGFVVAWKEGRREKDWKAALPGIMALSILAFSIMVNINIGVRHILLTYPLLAIQASYGLHWLLYQTRRKLPGSITAAVLLLWQGTTTLTARPDYLPWFNALAGSQPEHVLIDSDLDWGQDLKRLSSELRARGIEYCAIAYNGFARLDQHNLPPNFALEAGKPVTGWVAISLLSREAEEGYHWIKNIKPETRVGKSIYLYLVRPSDLPLPERAQARMREALFVRYQRGEVEQAVLLFEDVLTINPHHYGALWQRASALQDMGRYELAETAWKSVGAEAQRSGYAAGVADARFKLENLPRARQE